MGEISKKYKEERRRLERRPFVGKLIVRYTNLQKTFTRNVEFQLIFFM
jgi:hypothetical protein